MERVKEVEGYIHGQKERKKEKERERGEISRKRKEKMIKIRSILVLPYCLTIFLCFFVFYNETNFKYNAKKILFTP